MTGPGAGRSEPLRHGVTVGVRPRGDHRRPTGVAVGLRRVVRHVLHRFNCLPDGARAPSCQTIVSRPLCRGRPPRSRIMNPTDPQALRSLARRRQPAARRHRSACRTRSTLRWVTKRPFRGCSSRSGARRCVASCSPRAVDEQTTRAAPASTLVVPIVDR